MTIPPTIGRLKTYYDPSLWDRLGPAIQAHGTERSQRLIDGRWKTLEEVREMIGYLRALDWVITTADQLTRIDDQPPLQE